MSRREAYRFMKYQVYVTCESSYRNEVLKHWLKLSSFIPGPWRLECHGKMVRQREFEIRVILWESSVRQCVQNLGVRKSFPPDVEGEGHSSRESCHLLPGRRTTRVESPFCTALPLTQIPSLPLLKHAKAPCFGSSKFLFKAVTKEHRLPIRNRE